MCTRPEDACMHVHTPSPLHTHIYKQLTPPLEYIDSYPMPLKLRSPDYLNCPTETTDKNDTSIHIQHLGNINCLTRRAVYVKLCKWQL